MRRIAPLICLSACWGRNIPYEGGTEVEEDTAPIVTVTCGEDVDRAAGLVVEGPTRAMGAEGGAAPGLCVTAVDPTPALTGQEPTVLASSEVCDDGTYVVGPIESVPSIGMFIVIDDCADAADTVMRTATGIDPGQLEGKGAGDTLTIEALSVSLDWQAVEQADLEAVGWSGDIATSGYMAGIVEDASVAPVGGATVGCNGCVDAVYYEDADGTDGIYGAGAVANTSTSADAGGIFMIPAAPIFSYSCEDGGAHTWESTLLGSLPAYAVYIRFTAE